MIIMRRAKKALIPIFWVIVVVFFTGILAAKAGSLTPSAAPGSTMRSLEEIFNVLAGTYDASGQTASLNGNVSQQLKYIAGLNLQNIYNNSSTAVITTTDGKNITFSLANTTTDADFVVDLLGTGNTFEVRDAGSAVLTVADGGQVTATGNLDVGAGLDISGGALTFTGTAGSWTIAQATSALTQTGTGQVTFAGNLDAASGLDVTGAGFTVAYNPTTDTSKALSVSNSGVITGTGYAGYFSKTGAATTNVGVYATASGATNNYAAIFEAGNVGIGTTTPTAKLQILGSSDMTRLLINGTDLQSSAYIDVQESRGYSVFKTTLTQPIYSWAVDTSLGSHNFNYLQGVIWPTGNLTDEKHTLYIATSTLTDPSTFNSDPDERLSSIMTSFSIDMSGTIGIIQDITSFPHMSPGVTGTIGEMTSFYARGKNVSAAGGTVNNLISFYSAPWNYAGGVVNNVYGLKLDDPGGTYGNKWGVYQLGDAVNYFAGNVGIGTVTPSGKLHIAQTVTGAVGTTAYGIYNTFSTSAGVDGTAQNLYGSYNAVTKTGADTSTAATTLYGIYGAASNTGSTNLGTKNTYGGYFTATGDTAGTATAVGLYASATGADNNYAAIFAAGYVGIGTTAPASQIELSEANSTANRQSLTLTNTQVGGYGSRIVFRGVQNFGSNLTKEQGAIKVDGQDTWLTDGTTDSYMSFSTVLDATLGEKVRIDAAGNVGIGTTVPARALEINNSSGNDLRLTYNDADGSATYYTDFLVSSAGNLTITPSGGSATLSSALAMSGALSGITTLAMSGDLTMSGNTVNLTHSGTTSLTITSTSGTDAVEGVTFTGGALTGITTLAMSGDLTMSGNTVNLTHSGTTSLTITSTSGTVAVEGVTFTGANVSGMGTLGLTGDLTISGNTAAITHSGTTSLTIASTSGTVAVESVVFTGGAISSATSLAMGGALSGVTTLAMAGDLTDYEAVNDGSPEIRLGSADAEELHIQANYTGGAQTLASVTFTTDTALAGADAGKYIFNVDGSNILTIDDDGLEVTGGGLFTFTGTTTDALTLTATSLSTGSAIVATGPSGGTAGVTDALVKLATDLGNTGITTPTFGLISSTATIDTSTAITDTGVNLYLSTANTNSGFANTSYGIYNKTTDAIALGNTNYGSYTSVANTGAIGTGVTKNIYGDYLSASSTLATDGTTNVYGQYITTTATHAADAGTVNNYGLYIANGTSSTNGTSTKYGLYIDTPTGADINYGLYVAGGYTYLSSTTFLGNVNFNYQNATFFGTSYTEWWQSGGSSSGWQIKGDIVKDQMLFAMGGDYGRQLTIGEYAYAASDFDHNTPTNPTLYINDASDPDVSNNKYGYLYHDGTNFILGGGENVGTGSVPATLNNGVLIASQSLTSSGTADYALSITRTLSDAAAAGGADLFNGLLMNITETNKTGWNTVNLMDLQVGSTSQFKVSDAGVLTLSNRTSITDDGTTLTILPAAGDYVRIGDAGTTSQTLNTNDDLFISGKLEVDGAAYFDGGLTTTTGAFAGALSGVTTLAMSGDLTMSGNTVNLTHSGTTSLTIASTSGTVAVEGVTFTGANVSGMGTLGLTGDLTISGNTAAITHSGTTSLTITSTSGTVAVEGVTFTGGAISSATSLAMGGALSGVTTLGMAGDLTDYEATNDGSPLIALGSAAAERLTIQSVYDAGAQTLDYVEFATAVASATADKGKYIFDVDGTDILTIDDGGLELTGGITANSDTDFTFAGTENLTIGNTTNTLGAAGMLDLAATTATTDTRTLNIATTNTAVTGNTAYSLYNTLASSAVVTGTAQNLYGSYNSVTKTGLDTSTAATTLYGVYGSASNTGATDAGTKDTYGGYFSATGDTAGTSTAYGVYATASGADTNYSFFSPSGNSQFQRDSLGTTTAAGLSLVNTTDAAAGAQQISPSLFLRGEGWETNVGSSMTTDWQMYVLPVQGAAAPTSQLVIQGRINNGAWSDSPLAVQISNLGIVSAYRFGGYMFELTSNLDIYAGDELGITGGVLWENFAAKTSIFTGNIADGASAIGVAIGNKTALTTSGAKIVNFINDTTEKAYIDKDGGLVLTSDGAATTTDALTITATSLSTGSAIVATGPSGGTAGVTDAFVKLATDLGNTGATTPTFGLISSTATIDTSGATTDTGVNLYLSTANTNANNANTSYGIYNKTTDAIALGNTNYGSYTSVANTGATTTQTKTIYGNYISASGTGGITTTPTTNVYGEYITTTATHGGDVGTVNQYGLYIANGTSSINGTSTKYGLYIEQPTGADSNVTAWFGGTVGINETAATLSAANIPAGSFVVGNGALCVDNGGSNCDDLARTAGIVHSVGVDVTNVDLAENYPIQDETIVAGELVAVDAKLADVCLEKGDASDGSKICVKTENENVPFAARADKDNSSGAKVLGVVSTNPGLTLGGFGDVKFFNYKKIPVALAGRVPVKVNLEGGVIASGDPLALSSEAGVAQKAAQAGMIIGYALDSYNGATPDNQGKVLVFVEPGVWFPQEFLASVNNPVVVGGGGLSFAAVISGLNDLGMAVTDGFVHVKNLIAETITAKKVATEVLEMKDAATGETYCVKIVNGEWEKKKGECDAVANPETPPAENPPIVLPPVETPQVETPPVEETPPAEIPPAETPPTETPLVEQPPVEQPPAETPPAEQPPVVETPPAETPPVEQPPVETPPAEQPPVETPPAPPVE
ncbi:MAG: hypothetical protein Q8M83_05145 [bacterium]|nr:hypothetical protein [bacterium]